jgi:MFS transporter, ACS family, aldohexuronate transporter
MDQRPRRSVGHVRWVICALLFFATTVNYVDRAVLSVLEPELRTVIGWTATQYGYINAAFTLAYAIGFLFVGWMIDKVGTRLGYTIALTVWSLAAAGHALASNIWSFGLARFALGLGESGNFPAAIKTVAEWFPKKERAFTTGLFNSGTNVGAVLAPLIVPPLTIQFGWQAAFIMTGLAGLIWVIFWWPIYRPPQQHSRVTAEELAYIESDPPDPPAKIPWAQLFPYRQTWAFTIGKFLTDSVWWFYLFWFSPFMFDQFGVNIKSIGVPMVTVYTLASVGSIAGGWLSSWLLSLGWSTNSARKVAMLACALCVVPVAAAPLVSREWIAVLLIGVAAAAHQGFSANLFTLASDMFPRRAVGSVVGIGGFAGAMGGFIMNICTGWLKDLTGNFIVMFTVASLIYPLALLVIHLLVPRLDPVEVPVTKASSRS